VPLFAFVINATGISHVRFLFYYGDAPGPVFVRRSLKTPMPQTSFREIRGIGRMRLIRWVFDVSGQSFITAWPRVRM
jgi:hypothetical protein